MPAGCAFRRALLGGALGVAAQVLPARGQPPMLPQLTPAQLTQAEAGYEPRPRGIAMCLSCTLFVRPNLCRQVEGEVSPEGWCKLYDMVD